jgi:hypothetical protein
MVKMRKLGNDGKPFMFEGEEVIREVENQVADNMKKLNGVKWEVVEDDRNKKTKPQAARTEEQKSEAKVEPEAEVKKTTKKKSSKKTK